MQCAYAVLYWHLWPVWLYYIRPHYPIKCTIFGGKVIKHETCVLTFSKILSETFLIVGRIQGDINVHRSSSKVPVILVRFERNLNFLCRFSKNTQISNFIKIRPVGVELFRADGQTDMTKLIVAFRSVFEHAKQKKITKRFLWICWMFEFRHHRDDQ
jgi:hypothetical protein